MEPHKTLVRDYYDIADYLLEELAESHPEVDYWSRSWRFWQDVRDKSVEDMNNTQRDWLDSLEATLADMK